MGFFSQDCERCGHPILSIYSADRINAWMVSTTVIRPDGSLVQGHYDGYGRIGVEEDEDDYTIGSPEPSGNTVYHTACWEVAGRPIEYKGTSRSSADQGYFFGNEHNVPDPRLNPGPTSVRLVQ